MPLPLIQRREIWVVDLGYLGKIRPVLVVGIPFLKNERTLCIIVPHTTSLIGTRFEVAVNHPMLEPNGSFDIQQTAAVPAIKFVRRIVDKHSKVETFSPDVAPIGSHVQKTIPWQNISSVKTRLVIAVGTTI